MRSKGRTAVQQLDGLPEESTTKNTQTPNSPILFIIRSLARGGAERQLVCLANGLARRGHRVGVAVFYSGGGFEAELSRANVDFFDLCKSGRWDPGVFLLRLARIVRQIKPGLIHGYLPTGNLVATVVAPLAPAARVAWGVRASDMNLRAYDSMSRAVFRLTRALAHTPDLIIANSRAGALFHEENGYPADRIVVVPNGVDTDHFLPRPVAGAAMRQRWFIGERQPLIGFVGRVDPMKGLRNYLEAVSLVRERREDIRAVCVVRGTPEKLRALRDRVERMGLDSQVRVTGVSDDLPAVYAALDVLCLSSVSEGFPNVVAESMACGTPCVVTDVGDSARIVSEFGVVVRPANPQELAAGLLEVIDSPGRYSGAACREWIVAEFGLDRMVDRTEALLWPANSVL